MTLSNSFRILTFWKAGPFVNAVYIWHLSRSTTVSGQSWRAILSVTFPYSQVAVCDGVTGCKVAYILFFFVIDFFSALLKWDFSHSSMRSCCKLVSIQGLRHYAFRNDEFQSSLSWSAFFLRNPLKAYEKGNLTFRFQCFVSSVSGYILWTSTLCPNASGVPM